MRDLFYFSSIPWSYFHHRQQEICLYLASRGYRVFFIEPFQRGKETGPSIREIGKNIVLARAKGLPYERVLQMVNLINSRETNILLQCLINRYFIKRPICILDRVHGIDLRYVSSLGPIVCDLVDEITAFGRIKNKAMLRKLEKKAIGMSSALFSSSMTLGLRKQAFASREFIFLPNGISDEAFAVRAVHNRNGRPRAGFVGTISGRRIDFALVCSVANRLSDWEFYFIGPVANDIKFSGTFPSNISIKKAVDAESVPQVIAELDVGLIPYRHDDEGMDYVFPKKLFEYFAVGIPVVSTGLPECKAYADFMSIADSADVYADAIVREFVSDSIEKKICRISEARKNTWSNLLETELIPVLESLE